MPDGTIYRIYVYSDAGVASPSYLEADEGSPALTRHVVRLINEGLHLLPRRARLVPFAALTVVDEAGARVCIVWTAGGRDTDRKMNDLLRQIRDGSFDPRDNQE